jgi:hypothetical protein
VGDWNIPEFVQYKDVTDHAPDSTGLGLSKCKILFDFLNVCNLNQLNSVKNKNNRLLDLIISNLNLQINYCDFPLTIPDDHHPP